jgi:hypothetical protein
MTGKGRDAGDRLGKLVRRTKPEAAEGAPKGKKQAGQFGRRASPKTAKSRPLSAEERMLRAILAKRD